MRCAAVHRWPRSRARRRPAAAVRATRSRFVSHVADIEHREEVQHVEGLPVLHAVGQVGYQVIFEFPAEGQRGQLQVVVYQKRTRRFSSTESRACRTFLPR